MRKEIDPKIQDAAASYAAQFSEGTTLTHFAAAQWRAMLMGRR